MLKLGPSSIQLLFVMFLLVRVCVGGWAGAWVFVCVCVLLIRVVDNLDE